MNDILAFLERNWQVLWDAPIVFLGLLILSGTAAYLLARWRYEGIVESLRERVAALGDRITGKDEQLDDYRERLHLVPSSGTAFSRLTNIDLKRRALETVAAMRQTIHGFNERQYSQLFGGWRQRIAQMTEEERHGAWEAETQAISREYLRINGEWDAKFKADSILLRDELLARLPSDAKNERGFRTYEHPTNPIGMSMVADDLERLAKLLPDRAK